MFQDIFTSLGRKMSRLHRLKLLQLCRCQNNQCSVCWVDRVDEIVFEMQFILFLPSGREKRTELYLFVVFLMNSSDGQCCCIMFTLNAKKKKKDAISVNVGTDCLMWVYLFVFFKLTSVYRRTAALLLFKLMWRLKTNWNKL